MNTCFNFPFGIIAMAIIVLPACRNNQNTFDASGSFEAEETIISSEAQGTLRVFNVQEGETLPAGQYIGYIDSVQLHLQKKQTEARIIAVAGMKPDIPVQLSALREQLKTAEREKARIAGLVEGDGATPKQLDDAAAQVEVLKRQIDALNSSLLISSESIGNEIAPLQVQIEQLEDQLAKCRIVNPVNGTVLAKYANAHETVSIGKPLYKIADLSHIILRVYITGNQLPLVKLNQQVKVLTDDGNGKHRETTGIITWISDKAEFTPKTIQTKDERANLVYAVKVRVENNGLYKIGMYGEISFTIEN